LAWVAEQSLLLKWFSWSAHSIRLSENLFLAEKYATAASGCRIDTLAKICPTLGDSPRGLVRRLQGIRFGIG